MKRRITPVQSFIIVVMVPCLSHMARAQSVFSDVPDNHWAAAAVKRLAEAGIVEGYPSKPETAAPQPKAAALPAKANSRTAKKPQTRDKISQHKVGHLLKMSNHLAH